MLNDSQLTPEDELIAVKAFKAFLAGKMRTSGRILSRLPDEQRLRVWRYGLHPKIKAYRDAIMDQYTPPS
jgi:hypothetical protein